MKKLLPVFVVWSFALGSTAVQAEAARDQETVVARVDQDGVQRVQIVGGDYFFKPRHLVVKVNVPVELVLSKEPGIVPHTFEIDAPETGLVLHEALSTEAKKISFTPTLVGEYSFYCGKRLLRFKSHREKGMEGVLQVVQ